jgi:hypothetical protein
MLMRQQLNCSRSFLVLFVRFLAVLFLLELCSPTQAGIVTFDYSASFGQTPPDGPIPYGTAVFDDSIGPNKVELTVSVAGSVGGADVTELYFNLDPALDPTALSISKTGGDGPEPNGISLGVDAYQAGGDGIYDILIDLPPPPGYNAARFSAGETLVFEISGIVGLVASDFNLVSAPSPSEGGAGPFFSVMRFQSTGSSANDSDWVGVEVVGAEAPEPSTLALILLGLCGLLAGRSRKE